jgi:deazaflavin-dependent oxidoreductase (nitroreductase family)
MTQEMTQTTPPAFWRLLMKRLNPFMKWLLKSPFHGVVSRTYLLLTFTGRKSGIVYSTPVQYAQEGETLYIITSEGYTWWKNLRGGADVELHLRGKPYAAHADTVTDPQAITHLLAKVYPTMTAAQIQHFSPSKVALIVQLSPEGS